MDATAKLIAVIVLASFATERIMASANYLLDAERLYRLKHPFAERKRTKERRRVLLLALAASIAIAVVDLSNLRLVKLLGMNLDLPGWLDFSLTWLVLFAGADRARELLKGVKSEDGSAERKEKPDVRIEVKNDPAMRLREVRG